MDKWKTFTDEQLAMELQAMLWCVVSHVERKDLAEALRVAGKAEDIRTEINRRYNDAWTAEEVLRKAA